MRISLSPHGGPLRAAAAALLLAAAAAWASVEEAPAEPDPAAVIEPPAARTPPRPLDVDMTPFLEAYDAQMAQQQAEITGQAPPPARRTDTFSLGLRAAAVLLAICGIIVLAGYAARRLGARTPLLAGASLGRPMGRLYLDPKTVLHFVESGGRVLVVGATPSSIALITEFDAENFRQAESVPAPAAPSPAAPGTRESAFLHALRQRETESAPPDVESLRGDIQRLKEFLRESQRERT